VAVRPEAWRVGPAGTPGLDGRVAERAYLGSVLELTVATTLGEIFVISPQVERDWALGDAVSLTLPPRSVSVLGAPRR
jgi:iron(III) transport system ATP-binding protein